MTFKKCSESSVAQSDLEKAEEFNGQFKGVFNKEEHSQIPLLDRSASFMDNICVSKEGVTKLLKELNPSKNFGPDELHPRVLKELARELGLVFSHVFQQSILTGEIPKEWSLVFSHVFQQSILTDKIPKEWSLVFSHVFQQSILTGEIPKEWSLVFSHVFQQSILTGEIPKEWSLVFSHVFQQSILTDKIPKEWSLVFSHVF